MQKCVFVQARDLPPEKRRAAETLLGEALGEDELLLVRTSKGHIVKPGLTGEALNQAYQDLREWSDEVARRVDGVPQVELEAAIDEAVDHVRRHRR
jgi:hypothetical protein